jgi:hypothetical protein
MASVLGTGPLAVTTSTGAHAIIPLNLVSYDPASGNAVITGWTPPAGITVQKATDWATYLLNEEELIVDRAPVVAPTPPGPAFLAEAVHPGNEAHNTITLTFTSVPAASNPPSATSYQLEVTVENTYSGLELATLADVIGTAVGGGSKPGLVHLVTPPAPPPAKLPDSQTVLFAHTGAVMQAALATGSFTLEAPGDGGGATTFNVQVSNVADPKFDLKVTWKKSNTGTAASHATAFAYVLNISKPAGGDYGAPPAGTHSYPLTGGGDPGSTPVAATPPKATIPSA